MKKKSCFAEIYCNGIQNQVYKWNEQLTTGILNYHSYNIYELKFNDKVTLMVSRSFRNNTGFYLGVFVTQSEGLSKATSGIMGKNTFYNHYFDNTII